MAGVIRNPADFPEVIKAEIASYLTEKEILTCCHVNTKWYRVFNQNYIFKLAKKSIICKCSRSEITEAIKEITESCTQFKHCRVLRNYLCQSIIIKEQEYKAELEMFKFKEKRLNEKLNYLHDLSSLIRLSGSRGAAFNALYTLTVLEIVDLLSDSDDDEEEEDDDDD